MNCQNCGRPVYGGASTCPWCGASVRGEASVATLSADGSRASVVHATAPEQSTPNGIAPVVARTQPVLIAGTGLRMDSPAARTGDQTASARTVRRPLKRIVLMSLAAVGIAGALAATIVDDVLTRQSLASRTSSLAATQTQLSTRTKERDAAGSALAASQASVSSLQRTADDQQQQVTNLMQQQTQLTTCARDQAVVFQDADKGDRLAFERDLTTAIGACANVNIDLITPQ